MGSEDFQKYDLKGANYQRTENTVNWRNITRNMPGFLYKKFDSSLKDFEIEFYFKITNIKNYSGSYRLLITLLKLQKEPGTIMSTYIAELKTNEKYHFTFFQRKNRENVFVHTIKDTLLVGIRYKVKIVKKEFLFRIIIYDDKEGICHDSGELRGIDDDYTEILMAEGHEFNVDVLDESSGIIEDLKIIPIQRSSITIPEDKEPISIDEPKWAFISFCHSSGNDFASHLHYGLLKHKIKSFYSEESISTGKEWEKEIEKNVEKSRFLILIMTPGFEISENIRDEIELALKYGKDILPFKHKKLHRKHLCVKFSNGKVKDFNKEQFKVFQNKEELFREVYYELDSLGWFKVENECEKYEEN